MSFRISETHFKNRKIRLCSEKVENQDNIFTLITGKNGVGKTQLLTYIVNSYLDMTQDQDSLFVDNIPDRLIVHTNSKFDKFRSSYRAPKHYKNLTSKNYRPYNNEIFIQLLFNKNLNKQAIHETLIYLGYLPEIEYSARLSTSYSGKSYLTETMNFFEKDLVEIGFDININAQKQPKRHRNLLSVLNVINEEKISIDKEDIEKIFNILNNKKIFTSNFNFIFNFKDGKINYGILNKAEYQ